MNSLQLLFANLAKAQYARVPESVPLLIYVHT